MITRNISYSCKVWLYLMKLDVMSPVWPYLWPNIMLLNGVAEMVLMPLGPDWGYLNEACVSVNPDILPCSLEGSGIELAGFGLWQWLGWQMAPSQSFTQSGLTESLHKYSVTCWLTAVHSDSQAVTISDLQLHCFQWPVPASFHFEGSVQTRLLPSVIDWLIKEVGGWWVYRRSAPPWLSSLKPRKVDLARPLATVWRRQECKVKDLFKSAPATSAPAHIIISQEVFGQHQVEVSPVHQIEDLSNKWMKFN